MSSRFVRIAAVAAATCGAVYLAACTSGTDSAGPSTSAVPTTSTQPSTSRTPSSTTPTSSTSSPSTSTSSTSSPSTSTSSTPTGSASPPAGAQVELPRGGTRIIGKFRIVAFYGAPGSGALGVLGSRPPDRSAEAVQRKAAAFRGYGLPVQPAMELITTVAQGSPGPDGDFSEPIPDSAVQQYLDVAHRHKMLLILDIQPGRSSFLSQVEPLERFLLDPSVEVGLDPEWKVSGGQRPGNGLIGSTDAAGVNAVIGYLHRLVRRHHLPDKMLVVHEFTPSMIVDRDDIHPRGGVEVVFHADGFGSRAAKRNVFHQLDFPGRPFGIGFKLFFTQDIDMLSADDVMHLHPRPDVITYQ